MRSRVKTTISDVAAEAGVSIATVFNVLNNRRRIGEKARVRILEASKRLVYFPANLGVAGIEMFTPVLNAPEAGILGICSVQPKPVMKKDGGVDFVPHMGLSITLNHCATDGTLAGRFLAAMRKALVNLKF